MPIKPENRARYPANWKAIRADILHRAGHRCERCGVQNRTRIARGAGFDAGTFMTADARVWCADTGRELGSRHMGDYTVASMVDIVLTIAHLDHQPENCDPANLRALCQRCHLRHDAEHHAHHDVSSRHYDRWSYLPEKRAAIARWSAWLDRCLGRSGSDVLPFVGTAARTIAQ